MDTTNEIDKFNDTSDKPKTSKKRKIIIILVTILLVLATISMIGSLVSGSNNDKTKTEEKNNEPNGYNYYSATLQCLKPCFKFPETVKIKTYNYEYYTFTDYVLWRTSGTVEAENAYSTKTKHTYIVYIKVIGDEMYKQEVWIDEKCVYTAQS